MEQNEMLQAVLRDPQKLQSAIAMASSLLGGEVGEQMAAVTEQPANTHAPSADWMVKALPFAQQIMESSQQAISPEKRALLHAVKPFVSEKAGEQIDHGMRLVMLAHVASSVMGQFTKEEMKGESGDV